MSEPVFYPELATPELKRLMANPPFADSTPATEYLAGLKPRGIWKPPLSEEQVASAIVFGESFCSKVTDYSDLDNDPYMLWFPDSKVLISLRTTFAAIAEYVSNCIIMEAKPDPDKLVRINGAAFSDDERALMRTSFLMKVDSPHEAVSVLHIRRDFAAYSMDNIDRRKHDNTHVILWTFPFPEDDENGVQFFEYYVPKKFPWGKAYRTGFTIDFGALH